MLLEHHKRLADIIVQYFKDHESNPVEAKTISDYATDDKKSYTNEGVYYMIGLLTAKEILIREKNVFESNRKSVFILSEKGWAYENWEKFEEEEKRKKNLENRLLSNNVTSSKLSPIFAGIAIGISLLSFGVSFKTYLKRNERLSPELQQIQFQLKSQLQSLNNLEQTHRNFVIELGRIANSLTDHK